MKQSRSFRDKSGQRFRVAVVSVIFLYGLLVLRLIDLTIIDQHLLKKRSDIRVYRQVTLPAHRGTITDRHGRPLAMSLPVASLWIDPHECVLDAGTWQKLSKILALPPDDLKSHFNRHQDSRFFYIARQLDGHHEHKIRALNNRCLHWLTEYHRYYPEGASISPLLGVTNIDDQGQEGLEWRYDRLLAGESGRAEILHDRMGHVIAEPKVKQAPKNGQSLKLTIDQRLQFRAYQALLDGVAKFHAKAGSVVVVDVSTGEILAMTSVPAADPNQRHRSGWRYERNRPVTDIFEPGSTVKPFAISYALASGQFTPDSIIDTRPGWMVVDHHTIRDEHNVGEVNLTTIMQRSSNVGMSKVLLTLPPQGLVNTYKRFGFGQYTRLHLPGESPGHIKHLDDHHAFDTATLSFGYGLSANALQLAKAFTILANKGYDRPLSLLYQGKKALPLSSDQSPVVDVKVAKQVMAMLHTVVSQGGTGVLARVHGIEIAGKTGTASIFDAQQGYHSNRYISSFIGMAPYENPKIVTVVIVQEPEGHHHYGGIVAAPIFAEVVLAASQLNYL